MRLAWVVGSIVILSGCAPSLVGGNQAGGVIDNVRPNGLFRHSTADAFALADAHCQTFGKVARIGNRINGSDGPGTVTFDCVPAEGEAQTALPQSEPMSARPVANLSPIMSAEVQVPTASVADQLPNAAAVSKQACTSEDRQLAQMAKQSGYQYESNCK